MLGTQTRVANIKTCLANNRPMISLLAINKIDGKIHEQTDSRSITIVNIFQFSLLIILLKIQSMISFHYNICKIIQINTVKKDARCKMHYRNYEKLLARGPVITS